MTTLSLTQDRAADLESTLELFQKHTGTWAGVYRRIDAAGILIQEHDSVLDLELNGREWWQRNTYSSLPEPIEFTGRFTEGGILILDTPRLYGEAWKNGPYVLLNWQYKDMPSNNNHEIITLISDTHRMRTWQCEEEGNVKEFVVIEETRVSEKASR